MNKVAGVLMIIVGLKVVFIKDWQGNRINYEFSMYSLYIPVGFLCIYIGYLLFNIKNKKIEFSKCPKCKKSYNYSELKDGMYPTCDVKTIEMEEYFKKYPEELNDV